MKYALVAAPSHLRQPSFFKMICKVEPKTEAGRYHEKVIGVHAIGKGIDEMIQLMGVLIKMGVSKQDFENAIAVHPTASEEFVLMDPQFDV